MTPISTPLISNVIPSNDQASPPLINTLLEKVKNIFTLESHKKIADFFFSTPINTSMSVAVEKEVMSVKAFVGLPGDILCNLQLDLPKASLDLSAINEHPLIQHLVKNGAISPDITTLEQLMGILHTLPTQQTSIEWQGEEKKAVLKILLPGNASLTAEIKFPKGFDELTNIVKQFMPQAASGIMPSLLPLFNNEGFRFEWNGNTGQFGLEFAHRQEIKVNTLEIPGSSLLSWICKHASVSLPQKITGRVDFRTNKVEFDSGVKFEVKWGPFTKNIKFNSVSYDTTANQIALQMTCFGKHTITIPLDNNNDTTPIPKIEFEFIRIPDSKKGYSSSLIEQPAPAKQDNKNWSYFESLKGFIREKIPEAYREVFDVVAQQVLNGQLAFNLGGDEKFVGADFWLPDGLNCNIKLAFPNDSSKMPEVFEIGQEFVEKLKKKLELKPDEGYDIEGIVSLLLTLPRSETTIKWNGTKGEVVIETALPGGARLDVTLKIEQIVGRELKELPETLKTILSKLAEGPAIERTLAHLRPFLSTDFEVKWDGKSQHVDFKWPNDLGCQVRLVSPTAESLLNAITQIDSFIEKNGPILKPQADGKYNVTAAMNLLATLQSPATKIEWKGRENKAILTVDLPGNAKVEIEFDIAQLVSDQKLSPALVSILSKMEDGEKIIETLTLLSPLFGTNFKANLKDRSLNLELEDGLGCKIDLSFPNGVSELPAGVALNGDLLNLLKSKLTPSLGNHNIDQVMELLLTVPKMAAEVQWNGTKKTAILKVDLPGGAHIDVTFDIEHYLKKGISGLSPAAAAILMKTPSGQALMQLLESFAPLLTTDFTFKWDGEKSTFDIVFNKQQEIFIQELEVPGLETISSVLGKNSALKLPKTIHGIVDFNEPSITFEPKITFVGKVGIIKKELDLKKVKYNAANHQLGVECNCLGSRDISIDLPRQGVESDKPKPVVRFQVRPL